MRITLRNLQVKHYQFSSKINFIYIILGDDYSIRMIIFLKNVNFFKFISWQKLAFSKDILIRTKYFVLKSKILFIKNKSNKKSIILKIMCY